uniref:Putative secreted protein n=1 Tax=Anopheles triannulatus TaxID=58253 RepID=A0A2M4B542_9DIPT
MRRWFVVLQFLNPAQATLSRSQPNVHTHVRARMPVQVLASAHKQNARATLTEIVHRTLRSPADHLESTWLSENDKCTGRQERCRSKKIRRGITLKHPIHPPICVCR